MAAVNASDTIPGVQASPVSGFPRPALTPIFNMPGFSATATVASTGSGVITLTAAQLLSGLLFVDCQDAQSATSPTAALLCEAIPGVTGTAQNTGPCGFRFQIKNTGDSTLTLIAGTGATVTGTATVLTAELKEFNVVITNSAAGSEAYVVYCGLHSTF
jgi:hypothetical protein